MSTPALNPTVPQSDPQGNRPVNPPHGAVDPARPHPFRDGLPGLTQRQIAYRIDRLARLFYLNGVDAEDLRESLVLEVYRAMLRHDPSISKATTFAKGVMDIWYLRTCKELRRGFEHQRRHQSLPEPGSECRAFAAPGCKLATEVGLRLDLDEALGRLPRDLRELAEDLQSKSIPAIATERQVHRGTINRMVLRLREVLASFDPAVN